MRRDLLDLQRQLGLTTIFVTHDQEEANTISDRMAVLDQGIIQQVGEPMDLYDNPANRFVADFLGTANILNGKIKVNHPDQYLKPTRVFIFLILAKKRQYLVDFSTSKLICMPQRSSFKCDHSSRSN